MDRHLFPKCHLPRYSILNRFYNLKLQLFIRSLNILLLHQCNKIHLPLLITKQPLPAANLFPNVKSLPLWAPTQFNLKFSDLLVKFQSFKLKRSPKTQKRSMSVSESLTCSKKTFTINEKNSIKNSKMPLFSQYRTMSKTHSTPLKWAKRGNGSKKLFRIFADQDFSKHLIDLDFD